jgi:Toxin SymE, type I toxin-antitoxin system
MKSSSELEGANLPSNQSEPAVQATHGLASKLSDGKGEKAMRPRVLKIEESGDVFRRKVHPKIRLSGRWLERAGFKPGHRVRVEWIESGVLTLRSVETAPLTQ